MSDEHSTNSQTRTRKPPFKIKDGLDRALLSGKFKVWLSQFVLQIIIFQNLT